MKSIFDYSSYKAYLRDLISSQEIRGMVGKLAEAAGCDRTYLSQSLNSKVQLTADHAAGIAQFIGLSGEEQDYFMNLVLFGRASNSRSKSYFEKKLKAISENQLRITEKMGKRGVQQISDSLQGVYYSDPLFGIVHIITAIKEFQTAEAIADFTKKPLEQIRGVLEVLVSMGMITKTGFTFTHSGKAVHINRGTAYNKLNHLHWRMKAVEDANEEDSIHFSTVSAISRRDYMRLKRQISEFIEQTQIEIEKSSSETLVIFCCDWFGVKQG